MRPLGEPRKHYWLLIGMARRVDADLGGAMCEGRLDGSDWAGMVQSCRGCPCAESCRHWLDSHARAEAAPEYCVNRDRLAGLAA